MYLHGIVWKNICILYQKLKFPNLLMVPRLPSFLCILFIHALYGPPQFNWKSTHSYLPNTYFMIKIC